MWNFLEVERKFILLIFDLGFCVQFVNGFFSNFEKYDVKNYFFVLCQDFFDIGSGNFVLFSGFGFIDVLNLLEIEVNKIK